MQLPSRQEIRVRNLFNVVDCKLHWQKNGDYLCVKVDRTPKGTQVSGHHSGVEVLVEAWPEFVGHGQAQRVLDHSTCPLRLPHTEVPHVPCPLPFIGCCHEL